MTDSEQSQFEEYFQIQHRVEISVQIGGLKSEQPNLENFESEIPLPFKLASEMKGVEQNMLRPLRQLGDVIEPLANYLKAQSRKIDLMMSFILQTQDQEDEKFHTESYGGGGFVFSSTQNFDVNNYLICKLFFHDDAAAIYCHGHIIDVDGPNIEDETKTYKVIFSNIRDEDRELVVRASLHQQSKQLLKKTTEKQTSKSS